MLIDEDYESVHRAGKALHQRDWRRVFTLNEMFDVWASLVVEVENGYDETSLHEFTNDMACRTWLAEAWPMLTERIHAARGAELAELDARFRAATIGRGHGGDDSPWWLSRSLRVVRP